MFKKVGLLFCLLVAIVAFCNRPFAFSLSDQNNEQISGSESLYNTNPFPAFYKSLPVKNEHIKVRYMGGECRYDASLFLLQHSNREYNDNAFVDNSTSFIFSRALVLFKLRGPPEYIAG